MPDSTGSTCTQPSAGTSRRVRSTSRSGPTPAPRPEPNDDDDRGRGEARQRPLEEQGAHRRSPSPAHDRLRAPSRRRARGAGAGASRPRPWPSARRASPAAGRWRTGGTRGSPRRGTRPPRAWPGRWSSRRRRPTPPATASAPRRSRPAAAPAPRRSAAAWSVPGEPPVALAISAQTMSSNSGRIGSMMKSSAPVISSVRCPSGPVRPHPGEAVGERAGQQLAVEELPRVLAQLLDGASSKRR